jgi:hypothetical protein
MEAEVLVLLLQLAKHIVTEDMEVGYFPTNKLQYSGFDPKLFNTLPASAQKHSEFGSELKTSAGVKLIFKKPNNPVFTGNIYVLTNGNTGKYLRADCLCAEKQ